MRRWRGLAACLLLIVLPLLAESRAATPAVAQDRSVAASSPVAAEDPTIETSTPATEPARSETENPATATGSPVESAEPTSTATSTTEPAIATETDTPAATTTETPTATPTDEPTATATIDPTAISSVTPTPEPVRSNLRIWVSCTTRPETIKFKNTASGPITVRSVTTLYARHTFEPFTVNRVLRGGESLTFQAGPGARGTILTRSEIFTDSAGATDGVTVRSSVGTIAIHCPNLPPATATPTPTATPVAPTNPTARVTTGANMRTGPGVGYAVIRYIGAGQLVAIVGGTQAGYQAIAYGGQHGWIANGSIASSAAVVGPAAAVLDVVNLRAGPSTSHAVLTVLPVAATVTLLGSEQNGFRKVDYGGTVGWVYGIYLREDKPASDRWIDVDRSSGVVRLMQGNTVLASYQASMSRDQSTYGYWATALGTYRVYVKWQPLTYDALGDGYIRNWVGFDRYRANGFHSYVRDAYGKVLPGGTGQSLGCIRLPTGAEDAVFAFAQIGMRVVIRW